jgi:DNA (cytosine-5)-methyltransferase 1
MQMAPAIESEGFWKAEMAERRFTWYEFFAGGGMARLGLGRKWQCTFANEWCPKKALAYRSFFGPSPELKVEDVAKLSADDLPGRCDLVWASFPCQDLSLAGSGAGLNGERSGTFRPFWRLVKRLVSDGRGPTVIALENVVGTLTSHGGSDFAAIVAGFAGIDYKVGALVIDAVRFLPQSRPRLFLVGVKASLHLKNGLYEQSASGAWHPHSLLRAVDGLAASVRSHWVWWNLPIPQAPTSRLDSVIQALPVLTAWHSDAETKKVLDLMRPLHRAKVAKVSKLTGRHVGTIYKRTRPNREGIMKQCAEVRFDGISGCLRTPVGGSSRQTVIIVENGYIRTRLLSPREAARLMGVPDDYPLANNYNEAYHVFGDGVVVPVVGWLEKYLLRPLATSGELQSVA